MGFSQNSHNCMKVQRAKKQGCPKLYHKKIQSLTQGVILIVIVIAHYDSFLITSKNWTSMHENKRFSIDHKFFIVQTYTWHELQP